MNDWNWRDKDIIRLETAQKQFNAKRNGYARTHKGATLFLPQTQHKNIREFKSRNDFNTFIKQMERGTKKDAFKPIITKGGAIVTKWELNNARYLRQSVEMKKKALLKKNEVKYTRKQQNMKEARRKYLDSQTKISSIDLKELKMGELQAFVKSLKLVNEDIDKIPMLDERYKENYIKALISNFPEAEYHGIVGMLRNMSAEDIATAQYTDDFLSIENPYRYEESDEYIERLYIHWLRYLDG